jgi:hypothetical protein
MVYRISTLEQQFKDVQVQLKLYVPASENALRLQFIQDLLSRMERDVVEMKAKQEKQDEDARKRYEDQEKKTSAVQIRFLVSVISTIVLAAVSVFTAYAGHLFH